ncbi:MAG TPA: class I SAM-dependent methyltransferase [Gemmataceae bacterium]|jgi:SAM-dependent methyltransferase|nr:class I SAM-dependent methyltransferase [Gemmataceae bacterium]
MRTHPKYHFARQLPRQAKVLDIGCWNFSFAKQCNGIGITEFMHFGVDIQQPAEAIPPDYSFAVTDVNQSPLPFPDQSFDAVVSGHVIEHLTQPLRMMDEIFRVLKVGGMLYLECPSDRSLHLPSMPFKHHECRSLNFYDDPTHVGRPYSPQSLFRLFKMYDAEVVEAKYLVSGAVRFRFPYLLLRSLLFRDAALLEHAVWWTFGFCSYGIARKTQSVQRQYVLSN